MVKYTTRPLSVNRRSNRIQDLEQKLAAEKDQRKKIDLLNNLAWELRFFDIPRAIKLSSEARQLSITDEFASSPYLPGLAISLAHLGRLKTDIDLYSEGVAHLFEALELFDTLEDDNGRMDVFYSIGRVYAFWGNYPEALDYFLKSLDLAKRTTSQDREAWSYNAIGWVYWNSESYQLALNYLEKGLSIFNSMDEPMGQGYALENIASTYYYMGDYHNALEYGMRSLQIYQAEDALANQADGWNTIGKVYQALGDNEKALQCYQSALHIINLNELKYEKVETLYMISEMFRNQDELDKALASIQEALELAEEIGAQKLRYECHQSLAMIYKKKGEYNLALDNFEKFHKLEKAVFNENSNIKLMALEVLHQVEIARKEARIYQVRNVELQREIEQHKRTQAALEELATVDPLTRLYNRHHFFSLASTAIEQARRYNLPLSVILFDVDDFKQVNDTHGHHIGDEVLRTIGKRLRAIVRKADISCRYGGEEFAILLPHTAVKMASQIADRLGTQIAQPISTHNGDIKVTISLGVSDLETDRNNSTVDSLLNWADKALYAAKYAGKNCTAIYPSPNNH